MAKIALAITKAITTSVAIGKFMHHMVICLADLHPPNYLNALRGQKFPLFGHSFKLTIWAKSDHA